MSIQDSNPFAATAVVGPAAADHLESRHRTERPPPQREGVVSDPDQYFPDWPRPAKTTSPGREIPAASNPDA